MLNVLQVIGKEGRKHLSMKFKAEDADGSKHLFCEVANLTGDHDWNGVEFQALAQQWPDAVAGGVEPLSDVLDLDTYEGAERLVEVDGVQGSVGGRCALIIKASDGVEGGADNVLKNVGAPLVSLDESAVETVRNQEPVDSLSNCGGRMNRVREEDRLLWVPLLLRSFVACEQTVGDEVIDGAGEDVRLRAHVCRARLADLDFELAYGGSYAAAEDAHGPVAGQLVPLGAGGRWFRGHGQRRTWTYLYK